MDLVGAAIGLIPMILSLSVHEYAHAWSASKLGDDTAARTGRLTLNPMAHIDPFGTILLPVLLSLSGLPGFGWAKPVPIDPTRFRRGVSMSGGMALTASAGPISNVLLAAGTFGMLASLIRMKAASPVVEHFLWTLLLINIVLAVFNLIPLPPLDGSRVAAWLVPTRYAHHWHTVERLAPIFLIVIFLFGSRFIRVPLQAIIGAVYRLLQAASGAPLT